MDPMPDPGNTNPEELLGDPVDDRELISYLAALTTAEVELATALDRAEGIQ